MSTARGVTICVLLLYAFSFAPAGATSAGTSVGGMLSATTTWSAGGGPYLVTSTVQIPVGVTLTIEPGAVVRAQGAETLFLVHGRVNAVGTSSAPIIFDGASQYRGSIFSGSTNSPKGAFVDVAFARIQNANQFWYGGHAHFALRNSLLHRVQTAAYVWYPEGDVVIEDNVFREAAGFSVGHMNANVYIRRNRFESKMDPNSGPWVQNWASYWNNGESVISQTVAEYNTFVEVGTVAAGLRYTDGKLDARNNYWGTTDAAVIQTMIVDQTDTLNIRGYVQYEPYLQVPSEAVARAVPLAPTGVQGTGASESAQVTWNPPSSDGGAPITHYEVRSVPGDHTAVVEGSLTTATVSGLTNGSSYTFTVRAGNSAGLGAESTASSPVVAATVPDAPTIAFVVSADAAAVVTWAAPSSTGGKAVTGYTVTSSPGGVSKSASGSSRQATVSGLTNGASYTFTVKATNSVGDGPASSPSTAVVPQEATAPVIAMTAPAAQHSLSSSLTAVWTAHDASGVVSHDVRWRRARFDGAFGGWVYPEAWQQRTMSSVTLADTAPGFTYCFSARSTDSVGNTSVWTAPTCSALAMDERAATLGSGWSKKADSRYYASTLVTTEARGATIVTPSVTGRNFAVVATKCPGCGTVAVSMGGTVISTLRLDAPTTKRKSVMAIASYTTAKTGKLTIKVTSTDKKVEIDGIGISK